MEASKIKGFMIEKSWCECIGNCNHQHKGFNEAIDLQGQKQIGFNRERLALTLFKFDFPDKDWNEYKTKHIDYYEAADAIIADEENILEAK